MTHINVKISKAVATAEKDGIITAGMVGVPVSFMFDSWWDGLIVTAVFKGSGAPISVPLLGATETVVPWEVLKRPSTLLRIGAEGRLPDGTLVIPTTWATVGIVMSGANATDDLAKPPTPTAFDRIMSQIGNMNDLATEAKNNLVDAVNEAMTKGGVTEDYVDNAIQESGYYRQFPFKSIEISKRGGILYFYVNIEDLDDGVQYYLSPSEKEKRKYKELYPNLRLFMVRIYMECDDGTQKRLITGTGPVTYLFRLFTTNKCRLYKSNEVLEIDYSDRSTSSAIKTNYIYNSYYLTTGGNAEYIPTTEYSPATKKYVDDEVKAAANSDTPKSHYLLTDSGNGFEYYIKMKNGSLISFCKAEKIEVTTLPTTTEYVAGATLDLTGMVVTLTRQDGTTEEIAGYTTTETVPADGVITVTYVEEDVEYTTTFNVTIEGES